MEKFTTLEKTLLLNFLEELSRHQGNAGCNDYDLPNTPEGISIHEKSVCLAMSKKDAEEFLDNLNSSDKKINTSDFIVLGYLIEKLKEIL